jgi:hypothetical protein
VFAVESGRLTEIEKAALREAHEKYQASGRIERVDVQDGSGNVATFDSQIHGRIFNPVTGYSRAWLLKPVSFQ